MKEKITTSIRHALTAIPALGGYLATKGWVSAEEGAQLDGSLGNLYAVLAAILAAVVVRLLMLGLARIAPGLAPVLGGEGDSPAGGGDGTGISGGSFPCLLITAAALSMAGLLLPSCSFLQDFEFAGEAVVVGPDGNVDAGKVSALDDETGALFSPGIAEEDFVDGQLVLVRPLPRFIGGVEGGVPIAFTGATPAATGAALTSYGFAEAQANALVANVREMRAALIAKGIMADDD